MKGLFKNKPLLAAILSTVLLGEVAIAANCDPAAVSAKIQLWKEGSCLRGANMYQQEKYSTSTSIWNPIIKQQDLLDLRRYNANLVNFSVPGPYDVRTYQRRDDFFRKLDELVNYAETADLFVVLSFRTGPGRGEGNITGDGFANTELYSNATAQTAFATMWKEVATRYKGRKHIAGFDILVEPNGVALASWRNIAQNTINAIRSVDAETPILVSPHNWGVVSSLSTWTPLSGNHLIYTVHQYEPYNYTHNNQTANWSSVLDSMYSQIASWMTKYGQTIAINEFGISNSTTNASQFMQKQMQLLEQNRLMHAAWIWEVEYDPDYTYAKFDFKDNAGIFSAIQSAWKMNIVFPSRLGVVTAPSPTPSPTPVSTPVPTPTPSPTPVSGSGMTCGVPSMSAVSGKPTLYVYRECNSNTYGVQVFGGGSSTTVQFKGQNSVANPNQVAILSRTGIERNDVLQQSSAQVIAFALNVNNNGADGFRFSATGTTASPCLNVALPLGGQILAGVNKVPVANNASGISLISLGACTSLSPTPSPTPTPTPSPTPISSANIPMTSTEWRTEYDGFGFVNYDSATQSVVFAPKASTVASETHATLLVSRRHLATPLKNFKMTIVATTEQQLRTPVPNAWECFWIFFNYVYDANGKKITNYFTMKPNGIELGRAHDELGQNFLATAGSPLLQIGLANTYVLEKIGGKLTVSIDGRQVMSYDSATGPYPLYDLAGTIGLYSEDARVRVRSVIVEPR